MFFVDRWPVVAAVGGLLIVFVFYVWFWVRKIREVFLTGERQKLTLIEKTPLTRNTYRLRFALDSPKQRFGLPVLQHVLIFAPNLRGIQKGKWNNKADLSNEDGEVEIRRPYTPITGNETPGYVDFVVKTYLPSSDYPDGGKASRYIEQLNVGSVVNVRGPVGNTSYLGDGKYMSTSKALPGRRTRVNLIAGGTGITPCIQLLSYVLDSKEPTETDIHFSVIFANVSVYDIICRDLLERLRDLHSKRFKLWYTVDKAPELWDFDTGYVTCKMIQDHLFTPSPQTITGICGPPPMKTAVVCELQNAEYFASDLIFF